jgi:hypothetical protein
MGYLDNAFRADHYRMTDAAGQTPRLGEVLLAYGVITPEQLDEALEEQRRTGKALGNVIVDRGFAPGPIVAQALATQRGTLVKTEYSFATGFQAVQRRDPEPPSDLDPRDLEIQRLKLTVESRDAEIERLRDMIDQLRMAAVR